MRLKIILKIDFEFFQLFLSKISKKKNYYIRFDFNQLAKIN